MKTLPLAVLLLAGTASDSSGFALFPVQRPESSAEREAFRPLLRRTRDLLNRGRAAA